MDLHPALVPESMRPLIERAVARVAADDRALGLIVNGSVAAGTADRYSDLDLVAVFADDTEAELARLAGELVEALGDPLVAFTGEHVGEPNLIIALLDDPLRHVDVKCALLQEQGSRVEDGLVVWQRDGAIDRARADSVARWPHRNPQWIEDRLWVWLHYGATKAARGELLECLDALALLRSVALGPLIARRHGGRPSGVRRLEQLAPELVPALHATVAVPEPVACLDALTSVADLYCRVRPEGVRTHDRAERAVRDYLRRQRDDLVRRSGR